MCLVGGCVMCGFRLCYERFPVCVIYMFSASAPPLGRPACWQDRPTWPVRLAGRFARVPTSSWRWDAGWVAGGLPRGPGGQSPTYQVLPSISPTATKHNETKRFPEVRPRGNESVDCVALSNLISSNAAIFLRLMLETKRLCVLLEQVPICFGAH